jgi:hypothetical protein
MASLIALVYVIDNGDHRVLKTRRAVSAEVGRDRRPPRSPLAACAMSMAALVEKVMSSGLLEFFLPHSTVGA